MNKPAEIIGENLKRIREAKGFSKEALGKAIGVSRQTIYSYEKGTGLLNSDIISKLATILEVQEIEFLTFHPNETYIERTIRELVDEIQRDKAILARWIVNREDLKASKGHLLAKEVNRDIRRLDEVIEQVTRTVEVREKLLKELEATRTPQSLPQDSHEQGLVLIHNLIPQDLLDKISRLDKPGYRALMKMLDAQVGALLETQTPKPKKAKSSES